MAFTRVVFPAFCNPTIAIYSSLLKNFDLIQSKNLFMNANIIYYYHISEVKIHIVYEL